ncbi:hypothetical protein D3C76_598360 [compost metagenome]
MDQVQFWRLIDEACARAASPYDVADQLVEMLALRDEREIMQWDQIFWEYQHLSYKNKLWAAAYVINGGCSDDGFDYFRGWLTAQGKRVFFDALTDPDSLVAVEVEADDAFNEEMLAVGYSAYFKKLGMVERDYDKAAAARVAHPLDERVKAAMLAEIRYAEDIDCEWDEDDLESVVPRLCEKFY